MPISHVHKCIFVHIPKCAGTSIEKALGIYGDNPDTLFGYDSKNKIAKQHLTISQMLELGYISREIFDTYFKFAFIRDPYDRAVSSAAYHDISVTQFLNNQFQDRIRHGIPFNQHLVQHLKPQSKYIFHNGELAVDFIGRYEQLEKDWACVCDRLKITTPLARHNQSTHHEYSKCYSKADNDLVDDMYSEDFNLLNYERKKLYIKIL